MKSNLPNYMPLEGFESFPRSRVTWQATTYYLAQDCRTLQKYLVVLGDAEGFQEPVLAFFDEIYYPLNALNARLLRQRLPWMRPQPLSLSQKALPDGERPSFGFGDRLGLASPGHALAAWNARVYPIFAQQSVRENARTGRSPQQVLDEAMWGIFQTGWGKPWGADADHLKTPEDLSEFIQAGYTFFTVDPSEHVGRGFENASPELLKKRVAQLPWADLHTSAEKLMAAYLGRRLDLGSQRIEFTETSLLRALARYGGAIAHAFRMYQALINQTSSETFDFEISVDEIETPTRIEEHFLIANELRRLEVRWNSLALRLPGRFEKGVDFIGDLQELERELAGHAAVMRYFGNYRLSLHSGSDKFSVYEILKLHAGNQMHVKTAGTSYLEALRVIAGQDPGLFRRVLGFACQRYGADRATYHVSARVEQIPPLRALADADLPELLDNFHARQVLHVTFGSVLKQFGSEIKNVLEKHLSAYTLGLQAHFKRHLDLLI